MEASAHRVSWGGARWPRLSQNKRDSFHRCVTIEEYRCVTIDQWNTSQQLSLQVTCMMPGGKLSRTIRRKLPAAIDS